MKMEYKWAYVIQDRMQTMYMGPEILSPSYFIGDVTSEESSYQHWKEGAELIYKLTKSGLLYLDGTANPEEDLSWFYTELRNNDPFGDGTGLWMAQELGLTSRGREIVERFKVHLSEAAVNPAFIEEVERIFQEEGV
ncbi:hypothetical protein EJD96_16355 [Herbaspirillum seropedicae]|uniref:hypothetical protein n=1 Tax=Herbaspirillum seropedicae TaxID=964 RepID=UPI00111CCF71|nr:hypothetical protein [Herbaspirillum seropedicae]QDD65618.1 hypothetical protein EJD96_16355 [Herbaspirillum seropedicae]